ncbi:MAG: hypothetical protein JSS07_10230, partial [Proteobacteria bacterium]|nr:hypothetical protein [Pseudomonadota bacterium]
MKHEPTAELEAAKNTEESTIEQFVTALVDAIGGIIENVHARIPNVLRPNEEIATERDVKTEQSDEANEQADEQANEQLRLEVAEALINNGFGHVLKRIGAESLASAIATKGQNNVTKISAITKEAALDTLNSIHKNNIDAISKAIDSKLSHFQAVLSHPTHPTFFTSQPTTAMKHAWTNTASTVAIPGTGTTAAAGTTTTATQHLLNTASTVTIPGTGTTTAAGTT